MNRDRAAADKYSPKSGPVQVGCAKPPIDGARNADVVRRRNTPGPVPPPRLRGSSDYDTSVGLPPESVYYHMLKNAVDLRRRTASALRMLQRLSRDDFEAVGRRGIRMTVPDYQSLMLPVLSEASKGEGEVRIGDVRTRIAEQLELTPEDLEMRLPSGRQGVFENRVHWAKFSLERQA